MYEGDLLKLEHTWKSLPQGMTKKESKKKLKNNFIKKSTNMYKMEKLSLAKKVINIQHFSMHCGLCQFVIKWIYPCLFL